MRRYGLPGATLALQSGEASRPFDHGQCGCAAQAIELKGADSLNPLIRRHICTGRQLRYVSKVGKNGDKPH